MKKWMGIVWLVLNAGLAAAQLDGSAELLSRNTLLDAASHAAVYPNADVLLVEEETRIRYETDGTSRSITDVAYKILTEKGRQEKSILGLGYSANYGTTRFVRAEVIKADGRTIPVDLAAQSREAVNSGQMGANIYDPNQKEIQLTIPHLNLGDVLRYTIASEQTKTVVPNTWSELFVFEEPFPIRHAVYTVDAPAALPLIRVELKAEIPGTVTQRVENAGDRILYTWELHHVPQMFDEPQMPERYTVVQRLLLSTIPDWETLSTWYWKLSKPRLDAVTPAMTDKVRELTESLTNRQEKIEALYRFVSQDVRYMGLTIEDEAPGYEPHDVSLTFGNRYGVCRDKAALLVTLLNLAGLEACPVLIYVGPKKDPEVPQPWFNHAITAVRRDDGSWQLLDATNENTRDMFPAYLSHRSYLVASPDGETLQTSPVAPPQENGLSLDIEASLDESRRITGRAEMSLNGIHDTIYRGRLAALKPEEREPYFEERLKQSLGPARLTRLQIRPENVRDTTVPLSVTLDFEIENALATDSESALLQIPTLIHHFGLFGRALGEGIGLDQRRYPLNTGFTCGIAETVRLDLSRSGLHPSVLPAYETVDTPELYITRSISATNEQLVSRAEILLRTVEFSPEEYLTLKENLETSERNARKRVVLERNGFPSDANLATLSETVEYTLYNPYDWKEERTVRQQVLTYAGKKQISDLQIAYNSAVEQVALESATVTAPDGQIQSIDPQKEINLMDAPWVSDAPRYPAGKILVANLPGVEIGSLIEYRIVRTCRGAPFFSAVEYFSGHNPLLRKTVRVEVPYDLNLKMNNTDPSVVRQLTRSGNGTVIHEWSTENRERVKKEDHLPPGWLFQPTLLLSCGDLAGYAERVEKTLLTAARKNKTIQTQARQWIQGLQTRTEKITALRDGVDRAVRRAGPSFSDLPLSAITPADQILAEGYGNTTDRAVLLYALLDAAKLKPRFVLSSNLPRTEGSRLSAVQILQRAAFDTLLVAVTGDQKETLYLGDTGQYAQLGTLSHQGQPAMNLQTGKLETPQTGFLDALETEITLTLSETGSVELGKKITLFGTSFETFHQTFGQFTPEERSRAHQDLLSQISQSAQAAGDLQTSFSYPGQIQFSARLPAYAIRDGDHMYFNLPGGLGHLLGLKASRRENPYYLEKPIRQTILYHILLPEGWDPVLLPKSSRTELPAGAGWVDVNVSVEEGRITLLQRAQLNAAILPPGDYDDLLALNDLLTAPSSKGILLRKK